MITKKTIANKLLAYLQSQLSLSELTDWAEKSLKDSSYEDDNFHSIRNIGVRTASELDHLKEELLFFIQKYVCFIKIILS